MSEKNQCKWCGRRNENNPGDYYHEMACWRTDVLRRMALPNDDAQMDRLQRELSAASYTGD